MSPDPDTGLYMAVTVLVGRQNEKTPYVRGVTEWTGIDIPLLYSLMPERSALPNSAPQLLLRTLYLGIAMCLELQLGIQSSCKIQIRHATLRKKHDCRCF